MKDILAKIGFITLITPIFLVLSLSQAEAKGPKTHKVNCDKKKQTIQKKVDKAKPGDVIEVKGTCNERVEIGEQVQNITIDGQGIATVISAIPNRSTFFVRGTGIVIRGFTITGGSNGITVVRGGVARIIDNTIEFNSSNGISVTEGSSARIGILSSFDTVASPNLIQNNGGDGIRVQRSSSARIVGNNISNNGDDGIDVRRGSHADISDNDIDNNPDDGIAVGEMSGVNLGSNSGDSIFQKPNRSDVTPNGDKGIRGFTRCYANGRIGTLNGNNGARSFTGACTDSLI